MIFHNSSRLADFNKICLSYNHSFNPNEIMFNSFSIVYPDKSIGSFGLAYRGMSSGDIIKTIENTDGDIINNGQKFSMSDHIFSLSYARNIFKKFNMGIDINYLYETIDSDSNNSFGINLNSLYKLRSYLYLFSSVKHIGYQTVNDYSALVYELGSNYIIPLVGNIELLFAGKIGYSEINEFLSGIGSEISYRKRVFLRIGYNVNAEFYNNFLIGGGLKFKLSNLDSCINYSVTPLSSFNTTHQVGLSITFNKSYIKPEQLKKRYFIKTEEGLYLSALNDLLFDFKKSDITTEASNFLNLVINEIKEYDTDYIRIEGHSDDIGTDEFNLVLSQKRAKAIYDFLVQKGFSKDKFIIKGFGNKYSLIQKESNYARNYNRRVNIFLYIEGKELDLSDIIDDLPEEKRADITDLYILAIDRHYKNNQSGAIDAFNKIIEISTNKELNKRINNKILVIQENMQR